MNLIAIINLTIGFGCHEEEGRNHQSPVVMKLLSPYEPFTSIAYIIHDHIAIYEYADTRHPKEWVKAGYMSISSFRFPSIRILGCGRNLYGWMQYGRHGATECTFSSLKPVSKLSTWHTGELRIPRSFCLHEKFMGAATSIQFAVSSRHILLFDWKAKERAEVTMNMEEESEIVVTSAADCLDYVEKKKAKMSRSVFLSRVGVTVVTYPLDFVKTLMQIGYEPIEPISSVTLLGRRCLLLPNSIEYIKYVKQVDGVLGCFRGLGPRLVQQSVFLYSSHLMRRIIIRYHDASSSGKPKEEDQQECPSPPLSDADASIDSETFAETCSEFSDDGGDCVSVVAYMKAMCEDWCCRMFGIVVSFPFQVIAVRTIAEFVGRESNFSGGLVQGVLQIYQQDGMFGFFKGLMPKLVGDSVHLVACGVLRYIIRTQVCCEELRACMSFSISILIGSLTYPFIVISNTMIVSGAGDLAVGNPPFMYAYKSWLQCWTHLSALNQLRRGSSLFFRYYSGPRKISTGGKSIPLGVKFGPDLRKLTF